jgi:hypothetical protein
MTKSNATAAKAAIVTSIRPANLSKEFAALESKIRAGMKAWETVGECLTTINENSYHHERGFKTFESYVETIFDMTRDYAYKIMRGYEIIRLLKDAGFKPSQMPVNESQVRPLTTIKDNDDLIAEIWDRVVVSDKKTTAKLVKEIADELQGKGTGKPDTGGDDSGESAGDKGAGSGDTGAVPGDDDLPDTSREDEIQRLTYELAQARQRAATAEAKLAAIGDDNRPVLTKLQREMLNTGFKMLAASADADTKKILAAEKKALLS